MYLLYADESGTSSDPKQVHFVLAGICVFERQSFWLSNELESIAARFNPGDPGSIELHGNPMFGGKKYWRQFPKEMRITAIKDALTAIKDSRIVNPLFGCVVRKSLLSLKDPVEFAFEQLASRFDYFLTRLHKSYNTHRGIIVFDKSTYETTIQNLATDFRKIGHTWGVLRNLAEVPLFLDSKASRLIQLADLVAYAIFRKYEIGDDQFFSIIKECFDMSGGVQHGLYARV
jgi:Protein of unknown function (DUF3800)